MQQDNKALNKANEWLIFVFQILELFRERREQCLLDILKIELNKANELLIFVFQILEMFRERRKQCLLDILKIDKFGNYFVVTPLRNCYTYVSN